MDSVGRLGDDWEPIDTAPIATWVLVADEAVTMEMQHLEQWRTHACEVIPDFRPKWWRYKPPPPTGGGRIRDEAIRSAYLQKYTVGALMSDGDA